jgi:outer membrane receptor protein involved in Fe transport
MGATKNVEKGPSESLRIHLDYTLPVGETDKLEAGLQSRSGRSTDITELYLYNPETNDIEFVPEFSNTTEYYRNIYAAYAIYAGMVGDFGYQAGLRTEYTDRKISMTGQDDFILNRWDFFPTLHFSYNLPLDQQLMASYSRRINRPRGWYLEPFLTVQDAFNVRRGNPALKPEYIDSYDLGYLKKFGDNFLSIEAYYRVTNNKVERVSSVFQENVMLHTFENVGQDFSLGLEGMVAFGVLKWWDMEIGGNFYNYRVEGVLYEEPFKRTSTNWNTRFNNTFRLWKNGQMQLNSRYNSATVTAQGTSADYFVVDAAFKITFLNKALSANIQGRNLLATARRQRINEGPDFRNFYNYIPAAPVVMVTLSYRFNNFKTNRRGNGNGEGDEDF